MYRSQIVYKIDVSDHFKVTIFFKIKYLEDGTRYTTAYDLEWYHFQ